MHFITFVFMYIFYSDDISESLVTLTEDEAKHCNKVLRKKEGDQIYITDGKGSLYLTEIIEISKKSVKARTLDQVEQQKEHSNLTIAIAPTKNMSRFEWFLEKATEIGIKGIIPILSDNSERKVIKAERCPKILLSAMKQSKNLFLPTLAPLTKVSSLITDNSYTDKYIAHCMEPEHHLSHSYNEETNGIVLIGPEGDFTPNEIILAKENGWKEVSLGKSRLRTETAGIVACHIVSMLNQKI